MIPPGLVSDDWSPQGIITEVLTGYASGDEGLFALAVADFDGLSLYRRKVAFFALAGMVHQLLRIIEGHTGVPPAETVRRFALDDRFRGSES